MSSASGTPSRKMDWFRSMVAKLDNEAGKLEEVRRPKESNVERRKRQKENQVYG